MDESVCVDDGYEGGAVDGSESSRDRNAGVVDAGARVVLPPPQLSSQGDASPTCSRRLVTGLTDEGKLPSGANVVKATEAAPECLHTGITIMFPS
jgi:hypothetical protein